MVDQSRGRGKRLCGIAKIGRNLGFVQSRRKIIDDADDLIMARKTGLNRPSENRYAVEFLLVFDDCKVVFRILVIRSEFQFRDVFGTYTRKLVVIGQKLLQDLTPFFGRRGIQELLTLANIGPYYLGDPEIIIVFNLQRGNFVPQLFLTMRERVADIRHLEGVPRCAPSEFGYLFRRSLVGANVVITKSRDFRCRIVRSIISCRGLEKDRKQREKREKRKTADGRKHPFIKVNGRSHLQLQVKLS